MFLYVKNTLGHVPYVTHQMLQAGQNSIVWRGAPDPVYVYGLQRATELSNANVSLCSWHG